MSDTPSALLEKFEPHLATVNRTTCPACGAVYDGRHAHRCSVDQEEVAGAIEFLAGLGYTVTREKAPVP